MASLQSQWQYAQFVAVYICFFFYIEMFYALQKVLHLGLNLDNLILVIYQVLF